MWQRSSLGTREDLFGTFRVLQTFPPGAAHVQTSVHKIDHRRDFHAECLNVRGEAGDVDKFQRSGAVLLMFFQDYRLHRVLGRRHLVRGLVLLRRRQHRPQVHRHQGRPHQEHRRHRHPI